MDNVSTEENKNVIANTLPELPSNMSKRQLKKMQKKEKWLERKIEKRLRERAKAKEKRAYARANNLSLGPSRQFLKRSTMAISPCKLIVTIDLSFDELMIDKDIAKLTKQILRCYTLNRRATAPMQFSLTSFTGRSRADMERHNGYEHWDVNFHTESYLNIYPKDKIVYLTSESENVIDRLDHECVYVIGGLVDHNAHKGICYKLAKDAGVRHGRLPLDKFLRMKARKVLTIDHEAFLRVLPERKNAQPIVPAQFKEEESQDLMPVDVNNAMLVNVNSTMQIDVSNVNSTISVDINNQVCDEESANILVNNVESKNVLEEHLCAT
ncbi:tRNA methyltransferase 10 homolog A isoform X2 [Cataglyphis hispanica]|uniref:tRNA methyltransferase 10 homolog A isoform X2 n=1 Tax=Cataglyphis hispanica TaxID=1086592 RepID=UPI0021802E06|nr:tRNA methyltransferase 10 homolog A isoform X2 [Cataglyphis hispanica]